MYSFDGRIRYSECDETGRLSLVSMMNYLQDCSTFQSGELGMGIDGLASRGLAWVLANWRIEVDRLPAFGEDVTVSTWCYEMSRAHALRNFRISARGEDLVRADELPRFGSSVTTSTWCYEMTRAHALRNFQITDGGGAPVVRADSQWFVFDRERGHATRVPDDQRVYLSDAPRIEMAPLQRRLSQSEDVRRARPHVVTHFDLDTNHHVNNARYVRLAQVALDSLGIEVPPTPLRLQVQYRTMALLGDIVTPLVSPCENGWDVNLTDQNGSTYALVRLQAL